MPVDDLDASVTDSAVQSLRFTHSHLHLTLVEHYVKGYDMKRVAKHLCVGESPIKARLDAADGVLSEWFKLRAKARQDAAERMNGTFTP